MNNEHCEHREQNKQASSEFTGEAIQFSILHFFFSLSPFAFRHPIGVTGRRPLEQAT